MDFPYWFPTWALYIWALIALGFLFVCFGLFWVFVCFSHEKKKRASYCLKHENKSSKSLETPTPSFLFLHKSEALPDNAMREVPSHSISHKVIKILIPQLWGKSISAIMCAPKPRLFWSEFLRCTVLKSRVLSSADSNCDRGERRLLLHWVIGIKTTARTRGSCSNVLEVVKLPWLQWNWKQLWNPLSLGLLAFDMIMLKWVIIMS